MADTKRRARSHVMGFAVLTIITVYAILDMELPTSGLVTLVNDKYMVFASEKNGRTEPSGV